MPCLPNLGSKAPDFTVNTTFGPINLSDYCLRSIIMNLKREILNL